MSDQKTRYKHYMPDYCTLGAQTGPQTIVVRQVLGEKERQKVLDIHVCVPERKPAISQIVDVFVKNLEVNCVDVITDKVIVRGEFEVKAIYVACLPENPVHAVEIKHYKWTQDIDMPGARRGMDAEASVLCEFVDYDVHEMTRAYKYKYYGDSDPCSNSPDSCECNMPPNPCEPCDPCDMKPEDDCMGPSHKPMPPFGPPSGACKPNKPHKPMPPFGPPQNPCPPICQEPMPPMHPCQPPMMPNPCPPMQPMPPMMPNPCPPICQEPMPPMDPCQPPMMPNPCPPCCPPCPNPCMEVCCREFDVSIILKVTAKVLTDREVQLNSGNMTGGASQTLPQNPKG